MLYEGILTALLALPQAADVKRLPAEQRTAYYGAQALAIRTSARRAVCYGRAECKRIWPRSAEELAALQITVGWWESRFSKRIAHGDCHPWECDAEKLPNGFVLHKARGVYQQQLVPTVVPAKLWRSMLGDYDKQAWSSALGVSWAYSRCKSVSGALTMYATGKRCDRWSHAQRRVRTYKKVLTTIRKG